MWDRWRHAHWSITNVICLRDRLPFSNVYQAIFSRYIATYIAPFMWTIYPANTERSTNVRFWFSHGSFSTNRLWTFWERSQNVGLSYVTGSFFVLFWFVPNEPSGNVLRTLVSQIGLGSFFVLFWFVPNEPSGNVPRTLVSHIWDLVRFSFSFGSFPANLLGTFPERSCCHSKSN